MSALSLGSRPSPIRLLHLLVSTCIVACLGAGAVRAQAIYLNEAVIIDLSERVELYNPGPSAVDLGDRKIVGSLGEYEIPVGTTIGAGGYLTIIVSPPGDIFHNLGGEISIADKVSGDPEDQVFYGQAGGAPLAAIGGTVALCRAPDASAGPPHFDEGGYSDAGNWTLDLTSTFSATNDAPVPGLGSTVVVNEVRPGIPSMVEFYNGTALFVPVDVTGWFLSDGNGVAFLAGIVPSGGVLLLNVPLAIQSTSLVYLFNNLGKRVDQLGFAFGEHLPPEFCLARCPDGAGPYDGYGWATSGGGTSLFIQECTLGELNATLPECGNPTPAWPTTWGRLRSLYR